MKRRIIQLLKIAIAAGLITWLIVGGEIDFSDLSRVGERWPWLLVAQVPFAVVLVAASMRWCLLLRAQGIHYSFRDTYALNLIGWVFNQMLLGSLGGDMVKAYVVAREQPGRRSAAAISVLVDRVLGLFVLLAVALAAVLFNLEYVEGKGYLVAGNENLTIIGWSVFGFLVCALLGAGLFFSSRVRKLRWVQWTLSKLPFQKLLGQVNDAFYIYRFRPREVLLGLMLSTLLQCCVVCTNICLALALLPWPIPWQSFFLLIPVAHSIMALPISPAGVGTGEYAYAELLKLVGVSQGALICILQRVTFIFWALLGCFFYIQRKTRVKQAMDEARQEAAEHSETSTARS